MQTNSHRQPTTSNGSADDRPDEKCEVTAPSGISANGWWGILRQTAVQVFEKRLLGEAAAVAFYALLTVFPVLATLIWL